MQAEIKQGGDGVRCWNADAVQGYVDMINQREVTLPQENPAVEVRPGRLICYGCEVLEYDYGIRCTAQLTKTLFSVRGEIGPRPEDAPGSLSEIPGLLTRAPEHLRPQPTTPEPAEATSSRKSGLRGLFGR